MAAKAWSLFYLLKLSKNRWFRKEDFYDCVRLCLRVGLNLDRDALFFTCFLGLPPSLFLFCFVFVFASFAFPAARSEPHRTTPTFVGSGAQCDAGRCISPCLFLPASSVSLQQPKSFHVPLICSSSSLHSPTRSLESFTLFSRRHVGDLNTNICKSNCHDLLT